MAQPVCLSEADDNGGCSRSCLSTDEKYQKALAVCNQLALVISNGSITAFYMRIDQLRKLCTAWTNENCINHPSPNEILYMQTMQDIKSETDAALNRKSIGYSTKPNVTNNTERCGDEKVVHESLPADSESLRCIECGKDCKTACLLKRHKSRHANEGPGICSLCKKVFRKGKYLKNHMKTHLQDKDHTCTFCGKQFWLKWNLTAHLKVHDKPNTQLVDSADLDGSPCSRETKCDVNCAECGQVFNSAHKLERHLKGHAAEKPGTCEVCSKHFKKLSYLRVHAKVHKQRNFSCPTCGKFFTTQGSLNAHMLRHSKKFMCFVCGMFCSTKFSLQQHTNTHTGDTLFPCHICGRKFRQKSVLKNHVRLHNNERPYVCNCCGKQFVQSTMLVYHMRTHTGEKPYGCSICCKLYTKAQLLKEHMRIHSGDKPYACEDCGKCFRLSGSLKKHCRLHTGEKICWCSVCTKGFAATANLKTHMRTHTGEKPYACVVCECRFMYLAGLKKHLKSHSAENNEVAQN